MKRFKWDKRYLYAGVTAFLVIMACILFYMALEYLPQVKAVISEIRGVLKPITMGFIIAYLLLPMCRFCEKKIFSPLSEKICKTEKKKFAIKRGFSIVVAVIMALALIFALLRMVLPEIYYNIQSLTTRMPEYTNAVIDLVDKWLSDYPDIESVLSEGVTSIAGYVEGWAKNRLLPQMNDIIQTLSTGVFVFIKSVVNFFIGIVVSIYVLYNREIFAAQSKKILYSLFSQERVEGMLAGLRFIDNSFSNFFAGKLLDSLIIFVICYISMLVMNMQYAMLISVIIGITNIIPFFGPFIGAIPTGILVLMVSPSKLIPFIIFILVLQQVDGNIIGPKILGSTTGLNGFWVMFSILIGGGMFGFVGMVCGVPVFTVIYAGVKSWVGKRLEARDMPSDTLNYKAKGKFQEAQDYSNVEDENLEEPDEDQTQEDDKK